MLIDPNIEKPISLSYINEKLNQGLYSSIEPFLSDIYLCLNNGVQSSQPNTLKRAAAEQLIQEFNLLVGFTSSPTSQMALQLDVVQKTYQKKSIHPQVRMKEKPFLDYHPGSVIFESENDTAEALIRYMKFINSSDISAKIAAYAASIQSEIVTIDHALSLNISMLTPSNQIKMCRFVRKLLHDAALGNIEAFNRPFGEKISPVRYSSVGIL